MTTYLILKLVHVLAVVLFLGNIITGVFWKAHADRTRDARIIAHAIAGVRASDAWFTIPGLLLIVAGGVGAAIVGDLPILGTGWIFWAIVLFSLAGVAFGTRVAPLQKSLLEVARMAERGGPMDWGEYERLSRSWALWGTIATLLPIGAVVLMVLKPSLPGL